MTLDECRKVRDLLSLILASAKDKNLDILIHISEDSYKSFKPVVTIKFK